MAVFNPFKAGQSNDPSTLRRAINTAFTNLVAQINNITNGITRNVTTNTTEIDTLSVEVQRVEEAIAIPYVTTQEIFDRVNNNRMSGSICITTSPYNYNDSGGTPRTSPTGFIYYDGDLWVR